MALRRLCVIRREPVRAAWHRRTLGDTLTLGKATQRSGEKIFFFLGLGLEGDQKHLGSLDLGGEAGKAPLGGDWAGILTPRALRPLLGDHKDLSQEPSSAGSWGSNPYSPETACSARHSPGKPGRDGSYGRRQWDPQLNHTPTAFPPPEDPIQCGGHYGLDIYHFGPPRDP